MNKRLTYMFFAQKTLQDNLKIGDNIQKGGRREGKLEQYYFDRDAGVG